MGTSGSFFTQRKLSYYTLRLENTLILTSSQCLRVQYGLLPYMAHVVVGRKPLGLYTGFGSTVIQSLYSQQRRLLGVVAVDCREYMPHPVSCSTCHFWMSRNQVLRRSDWILIMSFTTESRLTVVSRTCCIWFASGSFHWLLLINFLMQPLFFCTQTTVSLIPFVGVQHTL